MNKEIEKINNILEKIKDINKKNNKDFIEYLVEENLLDDIQEINKVLHIINDYLDSQAK
jgi:predicted transcriptional regulator